MKVVSNVQTSEKWSIVVARSTEEIETIRPIWERMQQAESVPVLNVDIDRYLTFVESMKGSVRPHIIILYYNGEPKAMVIGRIERHRITCKLGYMKILNPSLLCLTVVYGGILGQPTNEMNTVLLKELIDSLKRGEADVTFLNHLRVDSFLYRSAGTMSHFLCRDYLPITHLHWQTRVPDTDEEFNATISRKRRKEWKRLGRRLEQDAGGPLEMKFYDQLCDLDFFIDIASKISSITYKNVINAGFNDTLETRSMLAQAAQNGWWRAYILWAGEVPCAFETGIIYGNTYFAEAIGYNPEWSNFSPGTILFVKVLEDLSRSTDVKVFDYGFGDAAYKERFGTESWPEASLYIFAPRLYPVFVNILRSSVTGLNAVLGYFTNKIGSSDVVKRWWRNRLQEQN